ncbi:MAG: RHS repeat protein [Lachnospiraceae bacterium]|nr:RHS repeat protein [Lachnospiraceae bacterium]
MTTNEYDEMDRLIKVTDKLGGIYTYTYDVGGKMTITYAPF